MGEHYAKSMVGQKVLAWCERCRRITEHVIVLQTAHSGKLGGCVDPGHPPLSKYSKEQERKMKKAEKERQNPRLF
jgi:hypothetical protein